MDLSLTEEHDAESILNTHGHRGLGRQAAQDLHSSGQVDQNLNTDIACTILGVLGLQQPGEHSNMLKLKME